MAFGRRTRTEWKLRTRALALGERTLVMGILNATPDSFSDGGAFLETAAAVEWALSMLEDGADIVDLGGESTRPGSRPVSPQEEQDRILPVAEALLRERPECVLSVDTWHAATALALTAAGAEIINDVSGFTWDPEMSAACAAARCGVVLMHTRGHPDEWRTMPPLARHEVLPLVCDGLSRQLNLAISAGVERERIILDPGFGFGKIRENNYSLLAHLDELQPLGRPLLAGVSRKSFLGRTAAARLRLEDLPPQARGSATIAATTATILAGVHVVRVHDVRPAVEAASIADAILTAL